MFSFCSVILLVFMSSVHAYDNYDEFSPLLYVSPRADTCLEQGTQCSEDCTAILFCSAAGATPTVSVNCTTIENQTCSTVNTVATCSNESDCAGSSGRFGIQCREAGNFPDPYNCRNSYTCESNNAQPTDQCLCPPGSNWVGPSTDCNTVSEDTAACCEEFEVNCDDPVFIGGNFGPSCNLTQLGYYYICERNSGNTTIGLHKCPTGQYYNAATYRCEPIPTASLRWYNEKEMNPYEKSVKVLPVCQQMPTPPTNCTYPGQVIAINGDCRRYWVCGQTLVPELRECEEGTHLECNQNGCNCIVGPCPPSFKIY